MMLLRTFASISAGTGRRTQAPIVSSAPCDSKTQLQQASLVVLDDKKVWKLSRIGNFAPIRRSRSPHCESRSNAARPRATALDEEHWRELDLLQGYSRDVLVSADSNGAHGLELHGRCKLPKGFRVLLVSDANNCMTQRACLELNGLGLDVHLHIFRSAQEMILAAESIRPNIVLCPFLTKKVPAQIFENKSVPCLIVHPGPEGDRGMSSIDWALMEPNRHEWGVTILQAEEEMDAGDIWSTIKFKIDRKIGEPPTKSSLYRIECIDAAMRGIHEVLAKVANGINPRPLDYSNPNVTGQLQPRMTQAHRAIDWTQPAIEIARRIRAADSQPGTLDTFGGVDYFLFGAHVENSALVLLLSSSTTLACLPKSLIGKRHGAVLVRTGHGQALWISHMKRATKDSIKLPAVNALPGAIVAELPELDAPELQVPFGLWPTTFQEIFVWETNGVCYLWFDFYNGAMNTRHCRRLAEALKSIKRDSARKRTSNVLVLMGGVNFFSNGINLNSIEAAADPVQEGWENIVAMDDFVKEVLTCGTHLTVSVLFGSAGAGGVFAAMAADEVWTHGNVCLHPSYQAMALYGSEYWTFSLPKRVGYERAQEIVQSTHPMSASTALRTRLVDQVLSSSQESLFEKVKERAEAMASDPQTQLRIQRKKAFISDERFLEAIQGAREAELEQMRHSLASPEFTARRHAFVFKLRTCVPSFPLTITPTQSSGALAPMVG